MGKYDVLFTPMNIGTVEIKNRFVMCPMEGTSILGWTQGNGYKPEVHDLFIDRAKDGIGLMIPGAVGIYSITGRQWLYEHPEAFEGVKEFMDEIHAYGSKVFFQLSCGLGRNFPISKDIYEQYDKLNPVLKLDLLNGSADAGLPNRWINDLKTIQLTKEDVEELVHAIAEAAYLCKQNGVDGIDVHAMHEGYLIDQFTLPYTNHRTDEYGGSLVNRLKFPCDVVKAIKARCGDDYPVILRYSVTSKTRDFNHGIIPQDHESIEIGRTMEESKLAIKILEDAGYDGFNADNGTYDAWYYAHPPVYMPLNCNLKESMEIKPYTSKPIICAGRMQLDESAEAISNGKLDFVGIGRQFLADEKYLTKIREERFEDIRPCISCHVGCMPIGLWKDSGAVQSNRPTGICALNPYTRNEKQFAIVKTRNPKHFAVIGGGVAGMEFALQAERRGHEVDLYEKSGRLGGVFNEAAAFSFKEKDRELIEFYKSQISKSGVRVHMNCEVDRIQDIPADEYIIATGSAGPRQLKVDGAEYAQSAVDFIAGGLECGENVVIIGGGLTGCEIAYELALQGKKPVIVELADDILKVPGSCMANTSFLRDAFDYYKVPVYTNAKTLRIAENCIEIEKEDGNVECLKADKVVTSVGYVAGTKFEASGHVHTIGDAEKIANLMKAVWDANELVVKLS